MRDKYLPIGSVVLLKGGKKRAMITGFCSVAQENQEKIYDYSGCVYPEGYLSSNQVCLFDHDQIDKIFFEGSFLFYILNIDLLLNPFQECFF